MKKKIIKKQSDINIQNKISSKKIGSILIVALLFMIALLLRVAYLQFIDGSRLQTLATSQQTLTETISAKRGTIYDSNGKALAISYDTDKVYITPSQIKDDNNKSIVAQNLSSILGIDYNELLTQIQSSSDKFIVASDVEQDKIDQINNWKKELKFATGISFE